MEINKKSKKELKTIFRAKVSGGKHVSRETLLGYAFVRGVPYVVLEKIINEDKFPDGGRDAFIGYTLGPNVGREVFEVAYEEDWRSLYGKISDDEDKRKIYGVLKSIQDSVLDWMNIKYEGAEVAA